MDNTSIVEKIIRHLSFDVKAIPQNTIKVSSTSKSTPVNVKIRIRKKNKALLQKGTISTQKFIHTDFSPQRVQLVSSDQTIASFNIYVESENYKTPLKKPNKHIFKLLKSGMHHT